MPEGEIYYHWFCCYCGEGPWYAGCNDCCVGFYCQHVRCENCVVGQETCKGSGATRKLLNPELAPPTDPKSLVAEDEEEDYDEGEWCERGKACILTCFGADARETPTRGELDYMLVAEHQLPIFVDELHPPTVTLTPSPNPSIPKGTGPVSWIFHQPWLTEVRDLPKARYPGSLYDAAERRYNKQVQARSSNNDKQPRSKEDYISALTDPNDFTLVWEHLILPSLVYKMQSVYIRQNCGEGFSISVLRSRNPSKRKICIMTCIPTSEFLRSHISDHVINNMLPSFQASFTSDSFSFTTGKVGRLASVRGTSDTNLDQICEPRNPFYYTEPRMGDSVGIALGQGDDRNASTLGPCLSIGDENFWLMNFHPFETAIESRTSMTEYPLKKIMVEHPSPMDRLSCFKSKHKHWLEHKDFTLGNLAFYSGPAYKTTRQSEDPYWMQEGYYWPSIVTDWALCRAKGPRINVLRIPPGTASNHERQIQNICHIVPNARVCSTGRTSGFQYGIICGIPAYVSAESSGSGRDTREWFVEAPDDEDDEDNWIKGGIGVEGDSGAGIVDCETDVFYGHLWGRNQYSGEGPRITYFTPVHDIFGDIQWQWKQLQRPGLAKETMDLNSVIPSLPVCEECVRAKAQNIPSPPSDSEGSIVSKVEVGERSPYQDGTAASPDLSTPSNVPIEQEYYLQRLTPSPPNATLSPPSPYQSQIPRSSSDVFQLSETDRLIDWGEAEYPSNLELDLDMDDVESAQRSVAGSKRRRLGARRDNGDGKKRLRIE